MTGKMLGALLIVMACTAAGFSLAAAYRKEERILQQLVFSMEYMENELQFQMPALAELCRLAASRCTGELRSVWEDLAAELDKQQLADAEGAMITVRRHCTALAPSVQECLELLGKSLGRFQLSGQITGIQAVRERAKQELNRILLHREQRLRSCRTLGICAGLALAILLI